MHYSRNRLGVYLLILGAALFDMTLWSVVHCPLVSTSRPLLYTLLITRASTRMILSALLVALVPLFLMTGLFGIDLLIMLPLGALFYYLHDVANFSALFLVITLSCAEFLHLMFARYLIGGYVGQMAILAPFLSTLAMVYLVPGSQGNRSRM